MTDEIAAIVPTVELDNSKHYVWRFSYDGPPELPQALKGRCSYCCWYTSLYHNRVEGAVFFAHHRTIPLKRPWWKQPTQWTPSTLKAVADWQSNMLVTHKEFGKVPPLLLKLLSDNELSDEISEDAQAATQRYSNFLKDASSKKRKEPPPPTAEEQLFKDAFESLSSIDQTRIFTCSELHFMTFYIKPAIERIQSQRSKPNPPPPINTTP